MTSARIKFLGLDFDNATLEETLEQLLARPREAYFSYLVTPNADHFSRLRCQPALRKIYQAAAFCLMDSQFLGNCARILGLPTPQIVTGADLTAGLLPRLNHASVAVIGMTPQTILGLAARYPNIRFIHHDPPKQLLFNSSAFSTAREFAWATQADFTFLALGSPVQELLAYAIAARREATGLGLCIGGALEYCAGSHPRAPAWMRRHGLEWAHRLAHDPLRLAGRYLISDPVVFFALIAEAMRRKKELLF